VLHCIEDVIAHEGARGCRKTGRDALGSHGGNHFFHRQGCEVCCWPTSNNRLIENYATGVIGQSGVIEIDCHSLEANLAPAFGLAEANHSIWFVQLDQMPQQLARLGEHNGQHRCVKFNARNLSTLERIHNLLGWVEVGTSEWFEAGEQNAFHVLTLLPCTDATKTRD
jgi:hypothetical protein